MATNFYPRISLIGGGVGALDAIDGAGLRNLDTALVANTTHLYPYHLNASSGAGESSPSIISPDANPDNKRWELLGLYAASLALVEDGTVGTSGLYLTFDDSGNVVTLTGGGLTIAGDLGLAGYGITGTSVALTNAKLRQLSAITAAGAALIDDANAAAQVATLGFTATSTEVNTVADGSTAKNSHTHGDIYYTETEIDTWRSNVTQTEMSYLDGVDSDIQDQLDAKSPTSHAMSAHSDVGSYNISTSGTLGAGNATLGTIGCGVITATGLAVDSPTLVVDAGNNRVGIGTATPGATLHLDGASPHIRLSDSNATGDVGIDLWLDDTGSSEDGWTIRTDGNDVVDLIFLALDDGGGTGRITFQNDGNIIVDDHGTGTTDQVVNVCYGTAGAPAAGGTTEGALFVKYVA